MLAALLTLVMVALVAFSVIGAEKHRPGREPATITAKGSG